MKKSNFKKTMENLTNNRHIHLQKLIGKSFEELNVLKERSYSGYKTAEVTGYTEGYELHYLSYSIIDEAIQIKHGNEEQAWDYLT